MGLEIVLHLQPVLDIPEKDVGLREGAGILSRKPLILDEFGEARESLRALEEGLPSGMEQLQTLRNKLNLANSAPTELYITFQFPGLHHLVFDRIFWPGGEWCGFVVVLVPNRRG